MEHDLYPVLAGALNLIAAVVRLAAAALGRKRPDGNHERRTI